MDFYDSRCNPSFTANIYVKQKNGGSTVVCLFFPMKSKCLHGSSHLKSIMKKHGQPQEMRLFLVIFYQDIAVGSFPPDGS